MKKSKSKFIGLLIGAWLCAAPSVFAATVIINEIMYDPYGADSTHEWVEIHNASSSGVDLTGWRIRDGVTNHTLTFVQGGATIPAGGFAIIADSATAFLSDYASNPASSTWLVIDTAYTSGLSNTGESLALLDASLVVQSTLSYASSSPWPVTVSGQSIERIDPAGPDNDGTNWAVGPSSGTPGAANAATPDTAPPAAVSDLTALSGTNEGEVRLAWTSPGDDGASGNIVGGQFVLVFSTAGIINNINSPPSPSVTVTRSTSAAAGAAQSFVLTGLAAGTGYWFAIKTGDENSNFSSWTSSFTDTAVNTQAFAAVQDLAPGAPSLGAVTSSNKTLTVPFSAPSPDPGDIVEYRVYRATYAFSGAADPGVTTTTYANALAAHSAGSLTNGVTYYFRGQAVDAGPNFLAGPLSGAVSGVPRIRPPSGLSAQYAGSAVNLVWSPSPDSGAGNFGGYNVYRATVSGGPYTRVASQVSGTSYQDSAGTSASTPYFYVLRSTDTDVGTVAGFSESVDSLEAAAALDSAAPAISHAPIGFVVFENTSLLVTASAVDFQDAAQSVAGNVQSLTLSFRILGSSGAFTSATFSGSGFGTASATGTAVISADFLETAAGVGGFTYFLAASDGVNTALWPAADVYTVVVDASGARTVGLDGGTVGTSGGFAEVVIAPNALKGDVVVTVSPLDVVSVLAGTRGDAVPVKDGYTGRALTAADFGPDGLRFDIPVQIRLKFLDTDGDGYPELPPGGNAWELPNIEEFHVEHLKIYLLSGGRWVLLGGRRSGDRVSVQTTHFSTYALFPAAAGLGGRTSERFITPNNDGVNDFATFGPDALRVTVYDMTGREAWSATGDGATAIEWPGTDAQGRPLESGAYIYRSEGGGDMHGVVVIVK